MPFPVNTENSSFKFTNSNTNRDLRMTFPENHENSPFKSVTTEKTEKIGSNSI